MNLFSRQTHILKFFKDIISHVPTHKESGLKSILTCWKIACQITVSASVGICALYMKHLEFFDDLSAMIFIMLLLILLLLYLVQDVVVITILLHVN